MAELILPEPPEKDGFNPKAVIPFGVTTAHIRSAMKDFVEFLTGHRHSAPQQGNGVSRKHVDASQFQ